jgi:hypothetical protein
MPSARIVIAMLCYAMLCTRRPGKAAQDIGISPAEVQSRQSFMPVQGIASGLMCSGYVVQLPTHSIATPQQSTRLPSEPCPSSPSKAKCSAVHIGSAWSRRCRPARGPSRRNLIVEWGRCMFVRVRVCISRLYSCYTTHGCHHQPQAPPTQALMASVKPQRHFRLPLCTPRVT